MGSSYEGSTMCPPPESSRARKKSSEHKANKQPQRGLGVAQLEKIRLHNQMMAAYRSQQLDPRVIPTTAGSSSSPSSHHTGIVVGVQYYLQPPQSGHERHNPPQQHNWSDHGSAEEDLDLELRL